MVLWWLWGFDLVISLGFLFLWFGWYNCVGFAFACLNLWGLVAVVWICD